MVDIKEYNDEPVFYCKNCLSLNIKTVMVGLGLDYCEECSATNIALAHIEEWRSLYKQRYGFDFLTKNINNGREHDYSGRN